MVGGSIDFDTAIHNFEHGVMESRQQCPTRCGGRVREGRLGRCASGRASGERGLGRHYLLVLFISFRLGQQTRYAIDSGSPRDRHFLFFDFYNCGCLHCRCLFCSVALAV